MSQHAIRTANDRHDSTPDGPSGDIQVPEASPSADDRSGPSSADEELWFALCLAPSLRGSLATARGLDGQD